MANPYSIEPANPLQALMAGVQGYDASAKRAKEAEQEAIFKAAGGEIGSGGLSNSALGKLFGVGPSAAPLIQGAAALTKARSEANQVFGTPLYGTNDKGEVALGTFDHQGNFRPIATPGFTPTPGVKTVDTGTGTAIISSKSGAPVGAGPAAPGTQPGQPTGYIPKDVKGEAQAKKEGTETGERLAEYGKMKSALDSTVSGYDRLAQSAKQVLHHPGLSNITGIAGVFPNIPGGNGANAQAILDNLKSGVGLSVLAAMREASKTGGALGSITEGEHKILQDNLAALGRAQSIDQFKSELGKIIKFTEGAKERAAAAFKQDYERLKSGQPAQAPQTPQSVIDYRSYFGGQ